MKRVVSVSLGSSTRNHQAVAEFGGQEFLIERIGVDGSKRRAIELIHSLDGKVDAFGLGGTDLYIYAGRKRYTFSESAQIVSAAKQTPVVDGSGLKNTLERRTITYLSQNKILDFANKKVFVVCAVDRFGLAEALVAAKSKVIFGDLMFGLGLSIPIQNLQTLDRLARCIAPIITKFPVRWFYPTGAGQQRNTPRFVEYFADADVIAGDFHFIRRFMPEQLTDKVILTNTVTHDDEQILQQRGAAMLITTTPNLTGRSYGTNVMEAVLVALAGKQPNDLTSDDYEYILGQMNIKPRIERWG